MRPKPIKLVWLDLKVTAGSGLSKKSSRLSELRGLIASMAVSMEEARIAASSI